MRYLVIVFLILGIVIAASPSALANLSPSPPPKIDIHSDPGTPDGREGGETAEDAIVVTTPFYDTGNTADNINDYDEACPYSGSTAPDVVYVWVCTGHGRVCIDLCDSNYDTKLYLYENEITPGAPYACNDDYPCEEAYRSALMDYPVNPGNTYYIVVDGYGSEAGDYTITIEQHFHDYWPCEEECADDAVAEGEPTLEDGYIDTYNSGCMADPPVFQSIDVENQSLCGVTGWYDNENGIPVRDTDWFSVFPGAEGYVTVSCLPVNINVNLFALLPTDCENVAIVYDASCNDCETSSIEFAHPTGEEIWLWVGPTVYDGPREQYTYILDVNGISTPSATNDTSWGELKGLFR